MGSLAANLRPPYYAAIVAPRDEAGLPADLAMQELISLAPRLEGFLGLETGRLDDGTGAAVCYWTSPDAVQSWKSRVLGQLIAELNLQHVRLEDACAIRVTRVAKRLFGGTTPLGIAVAADRAANDEAGHREGGTAP